MNKSRLKKTLLTVGLALFLPITLTLGIINGTRIVQENNKIKEAVATETFFNDNGFYLEEYTFINDTSCAYAIMVPDNRTLNGSQLRPFSEYAYNLQSNGTPVLTNYYLTQSVDGTDKGYNYRTSMYWDYRGNTERKGYYQFTAKVLVHKISVMSTAGTYKNYNLVALARNGQVGINSPNLWAYDIVGQWILNHFTIMMFPTDSKTVYASQLMAFDHGGSVSTGQLYNSAPHFDIWPISDSISHIFKTDSYGDYYCNILPMQSELNTMYITNTYSAFTDRVTLRDNFLGTKKDASYYMMNHVIEDGSFPDWRHMYATFNSYPKFIASNVKPTIDNSMITIVDRLSNNRTLSSSEYSVAFKDDTNYNAGEHTITITLKGDCYTGTYDYDIPYRIDPIDLNDVTISLTDTIFEYTGSQIRPSFSFTYGGRTYNSSTSGFTATYSNNIQPGTGTLTLTGNGNFSGSKSINFFITKKTITDDINLNWTSSGGTTLTTTYNGSSQTPTISTSTLSMTSSAYGNSLSGYTFTTSWSTNDMTNAGTKTATITGQNSIYIFVKQLQYTINKYNVTEGTVNFSTSLTYNGSAQNVRISSINITNSGANTGLTLPSSDYDIQYLGDKTSAGTQNISINVKSTSTNYSGSISSSYNIAKANLSYTVSYDKATITPYSATITATVNNIPTYYTGTLTWGYQTSSDGVYATFTQTQNKSVVLTSNHRIKDGIMFGCYLAGDSNYNAGSYVYSSFNIRMTNGYSIESGSETLYYDVLSDAFNALPQNGGTIKVHGTNTISSSQNAINVNKSISIVGATADAEIIKLGQQSVFSITGAFTTFNLEDFKFTLGTTTDVTNALIHMPSAIGNNSTLNIDNVDFVHTTTSAKGSAIYSEGNNYSINISNSSFTGFNNTNGGAISIANVTDTNKTDTLTVTDTTFTNNRATEGSDIYVGNKNELVVNNVTSTGSKNSASSGQVNTIYLGTESTMTIEDSTAGASLAIDGDDSVIKISEGAMLFVESDDVDARYPLSPAYPSVQNNDALVTFGGAALSNLTPGEKQDSIVLHSANNSLQLSGSTLILKDTSQSVAFVRINGATYEFSSLKEAVDYAQANSCTQVGVFASPTSSEPVVEVDETIVIDGNMTIIPYKRVISGNGVSTYTPTATVDDLTIKKSDSMTGPVFEVSAGASLKLDGMMDINGGAIWPDNAIAFDENGNAINNGKKSDSAIIVNHGTLTLDNLTSLSHNDNVSGNGGGIYNSGTVLLQESTIWLNSAQLGGAIYNEPNATVTVLPDSSPDPQAPDLSIYTSNSANQGSVIYLSEGSSYTSNGQDFILNNTSPDGNGSSIYVSSGSSVSIDNALQSGNTTGAFIYDDNSDSSINSTSIVLNSIMFDEGIKLADNAPSDVTFTSTFTSNSTVTFYVPEDYNSQTIANVSNGVNVTSSVLVSRPNSDGGYNIDKVIKPTNSQSLYYTGTDITIVQEESNTLIVYGKIDSNATNAKISFPYVDANGTRRTFEQVITVYPDGEMAEMKIDLTDIPGTVFVPTISYTTLGNNISQTFSDDALNVFKYDIETGLVETPSGTYFKDSENNTVYFDEGVSTIPNNLPIDDEGYVNIYLPSDTDTTPSRIYIGLRNDDLDSSVDNGGKTTDYANTSITFDTLPNLEYALVDENGKVVTDWVMSDDTNTMTIGSLTSGTDYKVVVRNPSTSDPILGPGRYIEAKPDEVIKTLTDAENALKADFVTKYDAIKDSLYSQSGTGITLPVAQASSIAEVISSFDQLPTTLKDLDMYAEMIEELVISQALAQVNEYYIAKDLASDDFYLPSSKNQENTYEKYVEIYDSAITDIVGITDREELIAKVDGTKLALDNVKTIASYLETETEEITKVRDDHLSNLNSTLYPDTIAIINSDYSTLVAGLTSATNYDELYDLREAAIKKINDDAAATQNGEWKENHSTIFAKETVDSTDITSIKSAIDAYDDLLQVTKDVSDVDLYGLIDKLNQSSYDIVNDHAGTTTSANEKALLEVIKDRFDTIASDIKKNPDIASGLSQVYDLPVDKANKEIDLQKYYDALVDTYLDDVDEASKTVLSSNLTTYLDDIEKTSSSSDATIALESSKVELDRVVAKGLVTATYEDILANASSNGITDTGNITTEYNAIISSLNDTNLESNELYNDSHEGILSLRQEEGKSMLDSYLDSSDSITTEEIVTDAQAAIDAVDITDPNYVDTIASIVTETKLDVDRQRGKEEIIEYASEHIGGDAGAAIVEKYTNDNGVIDSQTSKEAVTLEVTRAYQELLLEEERYNLSENGSTIDYQNDPNASDKKSEIDSIIDAALAELADTSKTASQLEGVTSSALTATQDVVDNYDYDKFTGDHSEILAIDTTNIKKEDIDKINQALTDLKDNYWSATQDSEAFKELREELLDKKVASIIDELNSNKDGSTVDSVIDKYASDLEALLDGNTHDASEDEAINQNIEVVLTDANTAIELEQYKNEVISTIDALHQDGESSEMSQLIEDYKDKVGDITYTHGDDKQTLIDLVDELYAETLVQKDYQELKDDAKDEIRDYLSSSDSEFVDKVVNDAFAEIQGLEVPTSDVLNDIISECKVNVDIERYKDANTVTRVDFEDIGSDDIESIQNAIDALEDLPVDIENALNTQVYNETGYSSQAAMLEDMLNKAKFEEAKEEAIAAIENMVRGHDGEYVLDNVGLEILGIKNDEKYEPCKDDSARQSYSESVTESLATHEEDSKASVSLSQQVQRTDNSLTLNLDTRLDSGLYSEEQQEQLKAIIDEAKVDIYTYTKGDSASETQEVQEALDQYFKTVEEALKDVPVVMVKGDESLVDADSGSYKPGDESGKYYGTVTSDTTFASDLTIDITTSDLSTKPVFDAIKTGSIVSSSGSSTDAKKELEDKVVTTTLDVSLMEGDQKVEVANGEYVISILMDERLEKRDGHQVVRVDSEGQVHVYETTVSEDGKYLTFKADTLDTFYVMTDKVVNLTWLIVVLSIMMVIEIGVIFYMKKKKDEQKKNEVKASISILPILAIIFPSFAIPTCIVLGVLVLGLLGYIIYTLVMKKKNAPELATQGANDQPTIAPPVIHKEVEDVPTVYASVATYEVVDTPRPVYSPRPVVTNDKPVTLSSGSIKTMAIAPNALVPSEYNRSFKAKLIQSNDVNKDYYGRIKNELMSYKKVRARSSWSCETFRLKGVALARMAIKGKTLCLYLGLSINDVDTKKYLVEDVSSVKKYEDTPVLYRIKNDRRMKYALELITQLMSVKNTVKTNKEPVDYSDELAYQDTKSLVNIGLIKVVVSKKAQVIDSNIKTMNRSASAFVPSEFNRSFKAKLIQSNDVNKDYYGRIKNELMSYKKVRARSSWSCETFRLKGVALARMAIKGKTLCLYLGLSISDVDTKKYLVEDVSTVKKYEDTPVLYRIKNDRRMKYALELITQLMSVKDTVKTNLEPADYSDELAYQDNDPLIKLGLIKLVITKKTNEINVYEASEELTDDEARMIILESTNYSKKGKTGIINIDTLSDFFKDGETVTLDEIKKRIPKFDKKICNIRVLARGTLDKSLIIYADSYSLNAVKMIALMGGKAYKNKARG